MAIRKPWLRRTLRALELAFVVADLNPLISEPIRYGSLFGVQAFSRNVLLSALCFGASTWLLDSLGAVATADLLDSRRSNELIKRARDYVYKARLKRLLTSKTSYGIDFCITLAVGTPITLIIKQLNDPNRNLSDNVRLGIGLSAVASLVAILQGAAMVSGLWNPNPLDITLAAVIIVSLISIPQWLRRKYSGET